MKGWLIRVVLCICLVLALPYLWNLYLSKYLYLPHLSLGAVLIIVLLVSLIWQHV